MKRVGVMRIHDFPLSEELAIPALAEIVDGICFVFHDVAEDVPDRLRHHPKCLDHSYYHDRFTVGDTLRAGFALADQHDAEFIICFDEDELPPAHFNEEFARFAESGCESMSIPNFECWGDPKHIVGDLCYAAKPHCHVLRWHKGLDVGAYYKADLFDYYRRHPIYYSPYPLRHVAFMTPALRERRFKRGMASTPRKHWRGESIGPDAWARRKQHVIPYDPNMTWEAFECQAKARYSITR